MTTFINGLIPVAVLVQAANGAPGQLLEPQTAQQWAVMVAAAARDGVTLRPEADDGVPACYRDLAGQRAAWAIYQRDGHPVAAEPGESNHGTGIAIDIDVTNPAVKAWLDAHATAYGFSWAQGKLSGEPWHWVRTVTLNLTDDTLTNPTTTDPEEDDDMEKMKGAYYPSGTTTVYLLFNEGSGFYAEHSGVTGTYNNEIAKDWDTGSWAPITAAHAKVIKAGLDKVRTGK